MGWRTLRRMEWTVVATVVGLLPWGCAPSAPPHVQAEAPSSTGLRLRFEVGRKTPYSFSQENTRSVEWRGVSEEDRAKLNSGTSGWNLHMTLTEQIRAIDEQGSATVDVTIEALRYTLLAARNEVAFDSEEGGQRDSALADLLGKTYTILLTPAGRVRGVLNSGRAKEGLDPNKPEFEVAWQLLGDEAIMERHTVKALASPSGPFVSPGQTRLETQTYSFGQMGTRSFDKVYTFRGLRGRSGKSIALVEMSALPSTRTAHEDHLRAAPGPFADVFADEYDFTGELALDIETGTLDRYSESLEMRWAGVDPQADPAVGPPASVHMTARQSFAYRRLDP